ncbi:MAG TPA: hypothetical protein VNM92_10010 [Thermoanaerobaculia bacterium]|nr:hypothetical protein [Thermoanaerobaculia bacterium]
MPFFLFPHDETQLFDRDEVKRAAKKLSDAVPVASPDAAFEWAGVEELFVCQLSVDLDAIWVDHSERDAFDYLLQLAAELSLETDLSDHDYVVHVHLHGRADDDSVWLEARRQLEDAT